jgi:hypothetical protein
MVTDWPAPRIPQDQANFARYDLDLMYRLERRNSFTALSVMYRDG